MNTLPTTATGLPTRKATLRMLDAVMRTGQSMDQAVPMASRDLESSDRALAIAIAQEVLRWTPDFDLLIDSQTQLPLADDAKARMVLRMALAQMLRLGTPPHAAIATALPLLDKGPRRLVHGVLGSLWRLQPTLPSAPTLLSEPAIRWTKAWGAEMVENARTALAEPPMLDLALKVHADTADWAEKLGGVSLAPGHVRLPRGSAIETLEGYADGAWWVQDLASTLPVRSMGAGKGRTVLDLCAAPGGKTMQLAAAGWTVTALDLSKKRMDVLDSNLDRTGLSAETVIADIRKWESAVQFDAVLLDAPCSATGTFRRHPDVLYRIGERQIVELVELQTSLLDHAVQWVKPGGMLCYASCSLEPAEGEGQAEAFLARHADFRAATIAPDYVPVGLTAPNGQIRSIPGLLADHGSLDGFFTALFDRQAQVML